MKRRTLQHILGLGLPATVAVVAVVMAQSDHPSTAAHSSKLTASVTKVSGTPTPSVTINGQAVPVKPNATTNFNDGTTKASVQNSGSTTSSQGQTSSNTSVTVSQSNNGNGTSTSDVTTSGGNSVSVTTNSSVEASGSGVTVTSN